MKKPVDINKVSKNATKGRVQLLHALKYMDCWVYVLRIDKTLFTYHAIINGEMYFSYVEADISEGKRLTDKQIKGYIGIILAGAHATIETVLGKNKESEQALADTFIKAGEAAWPEEKGDLPN
jgi:hypothetical protein